MSFAVARDCASCVVSHLETRQSCESTSYSMKPGKRTASRVRRSASSHSVNRRQTQGAAHLQLLLSELALLLVPSGITPKYFAELAKLAFVDAAGRKCRFRNGRFNQSRIAVVTGLNRSEVKRLLNERRPPNSIFNSRLARTERVIFGWISDRRFLDRSGNPRKLPITGRGTSFESLVRSFAGDVPHRAVLDELKRNRTVVQTQNLLELRTRTALSGSRLAPSLSRVLPALLDGIHLATTIQEAGADIPMVRLTLAARDSVELAILRDRLTHGMFSMIDGMKASLGNSGMRKRPTQKHHTITLTALLRESGPSK